MIAVLHAIERHTAALEARPDRRTEEGWLTRYRRHLTEHHGMIDPPDFDRRRRVPIADLYVPPTIVPVVDTGPAELDVWELDGEIDRTVLLGDPGAGKTTTATVLMHHHASDADRRVPFLVTLREYAAQDPPEWSVAAFVEHRLETFYQCPAPPGAVARLLLSGRALVVFDGLDELVDTARRADVTAVIERFCTEYPLARVLVTSRVVGYEQASLDDRQFVRYRIDRFADDRVAEYARKWFAQEREISPAEAEQWARAFVEESASVPDLRANPLMLALMCILYRGERSLPRSRAQVYERCAKLLFDKWDSRRRIQRDLQAGHLFEPTLRHLAHWLFTRDETRPAVTERELIEETSAVLRDHGFGPEAAEEFVEFCRGRMWVFSDVGTTAEGETLYAFTHRTFMEYFTATYLAYTSDTPEELANILAPHVARNEWEMVGELAVQIKDQTSRLGADRVYTALLADHRDSMSRSGILQFLGRCLRSVRPTPATVRTLAERVLDHLFAGDLNEERGYLPLAWLLTGSVSAPEVVEEVMSARAEEMIGSSDPFTHLTGLRFLVFLPYATMVLEGRGLSNASSRPLWNERMRPTIQTYASDILATRDNALIKYAKNVGQLSMEQVLASPSGLTTLLQNISYTIFGCQTFSGSILSGFFYGRYEDFALIGDHILQQHEPPFTTGRVTPLKIHGGEIFEDEPWTLDSTTYLGAVVCLLITFEASDDLGDLEEPTSLSALRPYIARRWGREPGGELPELPIPEHFQRLFRDWADRKVDFAALPQEDSGGVV